MDALHAPARDLAAHAKAFAMSRKEQPDGMWPGYVMGLFDAGAVGEAEAQQILMAAVAGQFAHNCEPMFDYEMGEA